MTLLLSAFLTGFGSPALAQNASHWDAPVLEPVTITGEAFDSSSDELLAGVEVWLEGTSYHDYTDLEGKFEFEDVLPGTYTLVASLISYERTRIGGIAANKKENEVDVGMRAVEGSASD